MISTVRSFSGVNVLGHPLLAEKLEAFPILRPDAAEDIPLARFVLGMLTGCGRCVLDHWDWRIFCLESPFFTIRCLYALYSTFMLFIYARPTAICSPLIVRWTLPSLLYLHVLAHDTDDSVASPFHSHYPTSPVHVTSQVLQSEIVPYIVKL